MMTSLDIPIYVALYCASQTPRETVVGVLCEKQSEDQSKWSILLVYSVGCGANSNLDICLLHGRDPIDSCTQGDLRIESVFIQSAINRQQVADSCPVSVKILSPTLCFSSDTLVGGYLCFFGVKKHIELKNDIFKIMEFDRVSRES